MMLSADLDKRLKMVRLTVDSGSPSTVGQSSTFLQLSCMVTFVDKLSVIIGRGVCQRGFCYHSP